MSETVQDSPEIQDDRDNSGDTLTPEQIAELSGPPSTDATTGLPDFSIPDDDTVEPDDEPEAMEEPEPEAEPEPEGEPEAEPEPTWDKDRQARDQELANLRKETQSLKEQLSGKEVVEPVELPVLDDYSDMAAVAKHIKAARAENAELREMLEQRDNKDAYNELLTNVCKLPGVGEEQRNIIDGRMKAAFKERGYGPGNYPSPEQTEDLATRFAQELVIESLKTKPGKTKAAPKSKAAPDTGKGGKPASVDYDSLVGSGDPADVAKKMAGLATKGIYPPGWAK